MSCKPPFKCGLQGGQSFLTSLLQLDPPALFDPHCIAFLDKAAAPAVLLSDIFGAAAHTAAQQALQVPSAFFIMLRSSALLMLLSTFRSKSSLHQCDSTSANVQVKQTASHLPS